MDRSTTPSLRAALHNIHRDTAWWRKVLTGGAVYMTVLGWPLAEGFHLQSMENIRRGFPSPLPRWDTLSDKMVVGFFGWVIDVFFFLLPLLVGGVVAVCSVLGTGLLITNGVGQVVALALVSLIVVYELLMWASSASLRSKLLFVDNGEASSALALNMVRLGLRPQALTRYGGLRLRILPFYGVALAVLWGGGQLGSINGWLGALGLWLASASCFMPD